MAELTAFAAVDHAINAGLFALDGPAVLTRSAALIQMSTTLGRGQTIGGTFSYAPDGTLTGGTIHSIVETFGTVSYEIEGLDVDVDLYASFIAVNDVFGLRAALFAGDDVMLGSPAADRLLGFDGDDRLEGGFENDEIHGNRGADTVLGGHGADSIHGGQGGDRVDGEDGDDLAAGSKGMDDVRGGPGADRVHGGQDNDTVDGGAGNDTVLGDLGDDALYGRAGADLFVFVDGSGRDVIEDWDPRGEVDRIAVPAGVNGTTIDDPSDLAARVGVSPEGALLQLGGGNVVLLRNYFAADLTAADFLIL
ncbi:MAG: calcium-binding protein [Alphaproteobacteria bacterium]